MRRVVVTMAMVLASCSSAGRQAEKSYELASESGNAADRCDAATKVAVAYRDAGEPELYQKWRQKQDDDCLMARMAGSSATGDLTPAEQTKDDAAFDDLQAELNSH